MGGPNKHICISNLLLGFSCTNSALISAATPQSNMNIKMYIYYKTRA